MTMHFGPRKGLFSPPSAPTPKNDRILPQASWEEVEWALSDAFKLFRLDRDMDILEIIRHDDIYQELQNLQEEICILMGWTKDLHAQFETDAIYRELRSEN